MSYRLPPHTCFSSSTHRNFSGSSGQAADGSTDSSMLSGRFSASGSGGDWRVPTTQENVSRVLKHRSRPLQPLALQPLQQAFPSDEDMLKGEEEEEDMQMDVTQSETSTDDGWRLMHEKPNIATNFRTPGLKFRRRASINPQVDYFQTLPDEVVAYIFDFLSKRDVCHVMGACKRFNKLGQSQSWRSLDVALKTLTEAALISILKRNIQVLRMAGTNVTISRELAVFNLPDLRLTHLDLSRTAFSNLTLMVSILTRCRRLQCLSLENQTVSDAVCYAIAANPGLTHLDLSLSRGLQHTGVNYICRGCPRLEEFNLSWCGVDAQIVQVLVAYLPNTMRHLNMAGITQRGAYQDKDIERLTRSCPGLFSLDLSDNSCLNDNGLQYIMTNLISLRELSLNRCYGVSPMLYLNCGYLKCLNVIGCTAEQGELVLKDALRQTKVNASPFNFTAKPTPPPAVTSIWGKSTRN